MKKTFIFLIILGTITLASCGGKDIPDPNQTLSEVVKAWEAESYSEIYSYLNQDKLTYETKDAFSQRLEKTYAAIGMTDLSIDYEEIDKGTFTDKKNKDGLAVPLKIKFKTAAGEISFSEDALFQLVSNEDKDTEDYWVLDWNEGLILPNFTETSQAYLEQQNAKRGEIVDRNQMPLALNDVAYEVGVVPRNFENESAEIEQIASLLSVSVESIQSSLNADWVQPDFFVPIQTIANSKEDVYNQLQNIPAVSIEETTGRVYPLGPAAAHITGYIGPISAEELEEQKSGNYTENDLIGKLGIEKLFEEKLRGESGVKLWMTTESETGSIDEELLAEKPVKNGEKVELNIDANFQEKIYKSFGDDAGSAVAIHPKTGETLALVNHPAFDPNEFAYGISQASWDQLANNPQSPLLNRYSATFAPGSVIKPITAAIGLQSGKLDPEEEIIINGKHWSKDNWSDSDFITRYSIIGNPVDLEKAMVESDNIYFAQQALKMGAETFIKGLKDFGFEEKIPFEFPIQPSQISNDGKLDEFLLANTSYGQGQIEMSPFHITYAYSAFLNEGDIVKPSFLASDKKSEVWKSDVLSKEDASLLKSYMEKVVQSGSAKVAKTKKLPLSGKTGTAELKGSRDESGQSNGWFISYPTKDEDILLTMMIEDVEGRGISGYVAEKAKNLYLDLKNIK